MFLWYSCGSDPATSESPGGTTGQLTVRLTDSPADYESVYIAVDEVVLLGSGEPYTLLDTMIVVDLLEWQNGMTTVLAQGDIPQGDYTDVQLKIGYAVVRVDQENYPVTVDFNDQIGRNIAIPFSVDAGQVAEVVLDFDVSRSIKNNGTSGNPAFELFPSIRAVIPSSTGSIEGTVTNVADAAVAYAVSSGDTIAGTFVDETDGSFKIAFLPEGSYTVAIENTNGEGHLQSGVSVSSSGSNSLGSITLQTSSSGNPVCGNGVCEDGEDENNCPGDCGQSTGGPICGNGICEDGEDENNCPADCGNTGPSEHFDTERAKPGVVGAVSWRNQTEINRDHHGSNDVGDPAYPLYDPTFDAAKMFIMDGEPLSQLRLEFPFVSGSVWTQHEIMLGPVLFTEEYDPYGMKLWRWEDPDKIECTDERRLTMNVGFDDAPHVYHRDGCPIPDGEVRVWNNSYNAWDEQPGGETSCIWEENIPHPQCFRWAPGVWVRLTYHFDFTGKMLHIWARRFDSETTYKIVEFAVPDWNSNYGFSVAGAWLHSTSRTHGNWDSGLTTAHIYARNMIISTNPIAF